eukprot:GEMP01009286.1.p1 GENE.GEMP01009286.1~~GEMP01009286.1.p1  ORF type:complete len:1017 (+),score=248.16 GEMP01009286.1:213-3263(+)
MVLLSTQERFYQSLPGRVESGSIPSISECKLLPQADTCYYPDMLFDCTLLCGYLRENAVDVRNVVESIKNDEPRIYIDFHLSKMNGVCEETKRLLKALMRKVKLSHRGATGMADELVNHRTTTDILLQQLRALTEKCIKKDRREKFTSSRPASLKAASPHRASAMPTMRDRERHSSLPAPSMSMRRHAESMIMERSGVVVPVKVSTAAVQPGSAESQAQLDELMGTHNMLVYKHEQLQVAHAELRGTFHSAQEMRDVLETTNTDLQSSFAALQEDHCRLQVLHAGVEMQLKESRKETVLLRKQMASSDPGNEMWEPMMKDGEVKSLRQKLERSDDQVRSLEARVVELGKKLVVPPKSKASAKRKPSSAQEELLADVEAAAAPVVTHRVGVQTDPLDGGYRWPLSRPASRQVLVPSIVQGSYEQLTEENVNASRPLSRVSRSRSMVVAPYAPPEVGSVPLAGLAPPASFVQVEGETKTTPSCSVASENGESSSEAGRKSAAAGRSKVVGEGQVSPQMMANVKTTGVVRDAAQAMRTAETRAGVARDVADLLTTTETGAYVAHEAMSTAETRAGVAQDVADLLPTTETGAFVAHEAMPTAKTVETDTEVAYDAPQAKSQRTGKKRGERRGEELGDRRHRAPEQTVDANGLDARDLTTPATSLQVPEGDSKGRVPLTHTQGTDASSMALLSRRSSPFSREILSVPMCDAEAARRWLRSKCVHPAYADKGTGCDGHVGDDLRESDDQHTQTTPRAVCTSDFLSRSQTTPVHHVLCPRPNELSPLPEQHILIEGSYSNSRGRSPYSWSRSSSPELPIRGSRSGTPIYKDPRVAAFMVATRDLIMKQNLRPRQCQWLLEMYRGMRPDSEFALLGSFMALVEELPGDRMEERLGALLYALDRAWYLRPPGVESQLMTAKQPFHARPVVQLTPREREHGAFGQPMKGRKIQKAKKLKDLPKEKPPPQVAKLVFPMTEPGVEQGRTFSVGFREKPVKKATLTQRKLPGTMSLPYLGLRANMMPVR